MFLTWKNRINCQGKMVKCQGILNQLKCGNPVEMFALLYLINEVSVDCTEAGNSGGHAVLVLIPCLCDLDLSKFLQSL